MATISDERLEKIIERYGDEGGFSAEISSISRELQSLRSQAGVIEAVEELDAIANVIDPHSFLPDNSGDELTAEMVKQGRELALSKAKRILAIFFEEQEPVTYLLRIQSGQYVHFEECKPNIPGAFPVYARPH